MGQKVNPIGLRLGITEDWRSRWFATKDFAKDLQQDMELRKAILGRLTRAGISRIELERAGDRVKIDIFTARPGIVIGKKGAEVDALRADIEKRTGKQVQINIQEIKRPELDAVLVGQNLAEQLEARVSFRRAMKKAVTSAMKSGAKGIRVQCSGRLGGSEMARREWYREGRVPLHTLRASIDYGFTEAKTTFGRIGVKVWVHKGEVLPKVREERSRVSDTVAARRAAPGPETVEKPAAKPEAVVEDVATEVKAAVVEGVEEAKVAQTPAEVAKPVAVEETPKAEKAEIAPKAEKVAKAEKAPKAEKTPKAVKAEAKPAAKTAAKTATKKPAAAKTAEKKPATKKTAAAEEKPKASKAKATAKSQEAAGDEKPKKSTKAKKEEPEA